MSNYIAFKHRICFFFIAAASIVLMFIYIFLPSHSKVDSPDFSVESGFYENAFYLKINVPEGCNVYYTLDSSIPDQNSILYTEPIYIDNASLNENVYSMIAGTSANPDCAVAPDYLIEKCNVIRAVAIKDSFLMRKSKVVTQSYFIGLSPDDFSNVGIISLVSSPENLFGSEKGIYVTGDIFEQFRLHFDNPDLSTWDMSGWGYWPANYNQRGREWEREAHITFWDGQGNLCLEKDIGIRIQGNWGRALTPKGLNLFARAEYDGEPYFACDFFDNSLQLSSLTLSAGGSLGQRNMLNDYLMSNCVQNLSFDVRSYRPYVLFLDGEYWGFYWLTERCDSTYLREKYGLGTSNPIIIKQGILEEGAEEDFTEYLQVLDFFRNTDLSDDANYAYACKLIDINSFIDYYAAQIYIARNDDWPVWNEAKWRTREISDAPYSDGKWRWILFDSTGHCMAEYWLNHDTLQYVITTNIQYFYEENLLFRSLWNNASFRTTFEARILEIADQCFDAEKMQLFIENYKEAMIAPLSKSWDRFSGRENNAQQQYLWDLDSMIVFFNHRRDVVTSWFD